MEYSVPGSALMRKDWNSPDRVRISDRSKAQRSHPRAQANRRYGSGEFSDLILRYLPAFCWQTTEEIIAMLEFIDEDIEFQNLRMTLYNLYWAGKVEKRTRSISRANSVQFKKIASL